MCRVTRNCFTCTKGRPIHLLVDHSHVSAVCEDRNSCAENLGRYCANAFFFDKTFGYDCDKCAKSVDEKQKRERWLQDYYSKTIAVLQSS